MASPTSITPAASPSTAANTKTSFGEDEILSQWAHYDNLAKLCSEAGTGKKRRQLGGICGLFAHKVTITEKLDGSNLGMWIRHNPLIDQDKKNNIDSWEVLLLQGRNQPIWRKKGFDEFAERKLMKEKSKNNNNNSNKNNKNTTPTATSSAQAETAASVDPEVSKKLVSSLYDDLQFMSTCLPQYGHAKNLGRLVFKMREYCVNVANALDLTEIEIFGEAFRPTKIVVADGQKVERFAPFASWHPFGYKDTSNDWELSRLTSKTHQLFSRFVILGSSADKNKDNNNDAAEVRVAPQTHHEVVDFLMAAQDNTIFPPPVMQGTVASRDAEDGDNDDDESKTSRSSANEKTNSSKIRTEDVSLLDGISSLLPIMINPPERGFEGVFIVSESGDFGCKFKTGTHDEQKRLPTLKDIGIIEDEEELQKTIAEQNLRFSKNPNYFNGPGIIKLDLDMLKRIKIVFGIMCKIFTMKIEAPEDVVKEGFSNNNGNNNKNNNGDDDGESNGPSSPAMDENWAKMSKVMSKDIETACEREFGKRLSFAHFDVGTAERAKVVEDLTPLVIKEVLEVYEESDNLKMPYTKEQLVKRAAVVVKSLIDKVPFQPLGKSE